MSDDPYRADPAAVANVAAMLLTHLISDLLKRGTLTHPQVAAIFRDTRKRYTTRQAGQFQEEEWDRQTTAILSHIHSDVLHFADER
jgi:hypothetical protein